MPKLFSAAAILAFVLSLPALCQADDCRLVYGVYDDYAPYEWLDNGLPRGINVDLFKALAAEAECAHKIVALPWPRMLDMLTEGEITMLSASMTPDRLLGYIQLPPDFVQYRVLVGRKGAPFVMDLEALADREVLVLERSVAHESLEKAATGAILRVYESELSALKALAAGEGDYALVDDTSNVAGDKIFSGLTVLSQPMFPTLYGFMLNKEFPHFARLHAAADRLKESGEWYSIINRAKDYRQAYLLRLGAFIVGCLSVLLLLIFLWNKSLQLKVRQRTSSLDESIARLKETEKALLSKTAEHESLLSILQAILESIPELVYIVDRQGRPLWNNRVSASGFDPGLIREDLKAISNNSRSEEFSAEDEAGSTWKVLALDFDYAGQPSYLLFVSDITENLRLRDELFMTSRYSALGEMAALVAHEINNPLGSIMHNYDFIAQQVLRQGSPSMDLTAVTATAMPLPDGVLPNIDLPDSNLEDEETRREVSEANAAVLAALERIKRMVEELRGYTMRQTREYGPVDLGECIKSAVGITNFLLNRCTGNFSIRLDGPVTAFGNYGQIEQMIINLLQNACYALTDKCQSITCSLEKLPGYARITVADEGVGMDENTLKNACKPYFTTRRDQGGTGLGLSLVTRLIKEHGGYLEIRSEPGSGTSVSLYFPEYTETGA